MNVYEAFEQWLRQGGHGKKGADHYARGARLFVAFLNGDDAAAAPWRAGADPLHRWRDPRTERGGSITAGGGAN